MYLHIRRGVHFRAVVLWVIIGLVAQVAAPPPRVQAAGGGSASINLTKSVDSVTVTPMLALTLTVDHASAIPGDTLTYTATLTNAGSDLGVGGEFDAKNNGDTTGTVAAYYDYVEYFSLADNAWIPLAGTAASQSGYVPVQAPPVSTGLTLSAQGQPSGGVIYPSSGDAILGTSIPQHDTATWTYMASISLTPSQVEQLLDAAQVSKIRNVVHFEMTPRDPKNGQPFIFRTDFASLLQAQSGVATDATITITSPSGEATSFDSSTNPQLASIAPGDSRIVHSTYVVPAADVKGSTETDAQYLARLAALDGTSLVGTADAAAIGGGASLTAPQASATTIEYVPVLSIDKSGPATVDAGGTAHYDLALANSGRADASHLGITDALPGSDTGSVSDVPTALAAGDSATAHAAYDVPDSQPEGDLTDTASLVWEDANGNAYGPVSDSFTTQVENTLVGAHLVLEPESAGPLVVGTDHTLTVTATNAGGGAIGGLSVQLAITGPNATSTTLTTDSSGQASFTYTGQAAGTDVAQASATRGSTTIQSNTAQAVWLEPVNPISTTQILGRFFTSDGSGEFHATPAQTPAFSEYFPTIDFNPVAGTIPGNTSGVGVYTRPFSDITTDLAGNYTGRIVAEGNGYQAGVGALYTMNAVFTGEFTVAAAGDQTFDFYSDDGFIFGIGNGATRVSGALTNPPASGLTPFESYPVVGSYNGPTSPVANSVTVHFPAAGTYPYELDYSECCGGQLVLTMASHVSGHGVPPSGSLSLTPFTIPAKQTGQSQTMTVAAMDAAGQPLGGLPIVLTITGPNDGQMQATTDGAGIATFTYVGQHAGTDQLQVGANVSGSPAISNIVSLTWTAPPTPKPEIGSVGPADGTTVTQPVPITATLSPPAGETITSWSVTYLRVGTSGTTTLASGSGTPPATLATFDPTVLLNGTYTLTISATSSGGGTQSTTTTLVVDGNLKLGRYTTTYQDLAVPVAGLPIQVLRTYDSFDKSVGDFGYGWRVQIANFQVSTGRALGAGGWTQYNVQCFFGLCITGFHSSIPHVVTVTWPDGHQELFDFTPGGGTNIFWTGTAAFTGRPGTTSTLTVDGDNSVSYIGDGNLYAGFLGSSTIFNPQRFRLTAKDGTVYLLDRTSGLVSATDVNGNVLTVNANGVSSSLGPSISFTRDSQHRITQIQDPDGGSLFYTYDGNGDLTRVTDQSGTEVNYGYDSGHQLLSISGASGPPLRQITYGPDGRLQSITDAAGNTTQLSLDTATRTETITGPDPRLTTITAYDDRGNATQIDEVFSGTDLTWRTTYNDLDLPETVTDPLGHVSRATYDDQGNLTQLIDRDGVQTDVTYNDLGQPLTVSVAGSLQSSYHYDSAGNVLDIDYPDGSAAHFTYDHGHLATSTDVAGRVTSYGYDANGYIATVSGVNGTAHIVHDASGRQTAVTDVLGGTTYYGYDDVGHLTSLISPDGRNNLYHYDAFGRLVTEEDALGHLTRYAYDDAGHLASITDRDGVTTTFSYGPDGQVTSQTASDGTAQDFTYDPLGRVLTAANNVSQIALTWDDASRITSETLSARNGSGVPTASLVRTWTDASQPLSVADAFGTTTFGFDSAGRLSQVSDSLAGDFGFSYDALGRLTRLTRPNGVDDTFTYLADRLRSRVANLGTSVVASQSLAYDSAGLVSSMTDLAGQSTYSYDALGRLTGATHPAGSGLADEAYTYDAAGNRTSWVGSPVADVSYDAGDRLLSDGVNTYQYDDDGRLVQKTDRRSGALTTYEWNAQGQLTTVTPPSGPAITYLYDAFGRRISTQVGGTATYTVFDGPNPRLVLDSAGDLQARYVEGLGLDGVLAVSDAAGQQFYPVAGASATVVARTDAAGAVTDRYAYDSFGNPAAGTTPSGQHAWQGLAPDPAGDYLARVRTYDPATGRFLSPDPLPSINNYTYAADNPISISDPTGLSDLVEYAELNQEEVQTAPEICLEGEALAGTFLDLATDIVFTSALDLVVPNGPGIYAFFDQDAGATYVGRSVNLRRRILEHLRAGRPLPESGLKILEVQGESLRDLQAAEQLAINECGGVSNLANKINAANEVRRQQISELYSTLADLLARLGGP